jgi:rhamnogalacturonan endolyase
LHIHNDRNLGVKYIFYLNTIFIIGILLTGGCTRKEKSGKDPDFLILIADNKSGTEVSSWISWSHNDLLTSEYSEEVVKDGQHSIKLEFPDVESRGYHDWSFWNERLIEVKPGQVWTASAWVKYENTERIGLDILAISNGEIVPSWSNGFGWSSGLAAAYGTGDWELLEATATIPSGADQIYVRFTGAGKTTLWIDGVRLHEGNAQRKRSPRPHVEGWAFQKERVKEQLDRGMVAFTREDGSIYVQWRLLDNDPADIAFNIYQVKDRSLPVRLNDEPIFRTTDFIDHTAILNVHNVYFVRSVKDGKEYETSERYSINANTPIKPYLSLKLGSDTTTFQKVGIGDLNGDGRYDFVIKTPNTSLDPWYWRPSETTYKLEAYLSDGTFLWHRDLGWNIEAGMWYSPYVVYDFNGDGRAEIAVKTAPMDIDYRETKPCPYGIYKAGRVTSGPEYISILDGMTGEEIARADWPSRDGMGIYHHAARHQLGVAYLDGKTPSLIAARGTYTVMKLAAYQFYNNKLDELWTWDSSDEPGGLYYGQGSHFMQSVDVNGNGKDAIVIGAAVIDSNGEGLWSSGLGHADNVWVGNIDPTRKGLEIYLGIEGARAKGSLKHGVSLRDAQTGELLWGLDQTTHHVHGAGLCSNIDSRHVGMECYSGEHSRPNRWLHTAQGQLIADENEWRMGLSPRAVYWDASTEREVLMGNRIFRFPDETITENIEGHQMAWFDLMGDWREEVITSVPGELRIYPTPIPAEDRRITLMQDPLYRSGVAHLSMGYGQPPLTSYYLFPSQK